MKAENRSLSLFIALPTLGPSFPSKVCFKWGKTRYYKFDLKLILISVVVQMKMSLSPKAYYLLEHILGISHHVSLTLNPSKTLLLNVEYSLARCCEYGREKQCGSAVG